jgi:hypothetical protein
VATGKHAVVVAAMITGPSRTEGSKPASDAAAQLAGALAGQFAQLLTGVAQDRGDAVPGFVRRRFRTTVAGRHAGKPAGLVLKAPRLGEQVLHPAARGAGVGGSRRGPTAGRLGVPNAPPRGVAQDLVGLLHGRKRSGTAACIGMGSSHRSAVRRVDLRFIRASCHS